MFIVNEITAINDVDCIDACVFMSNKQAILYSTHHQDLQSSHLPLVNQKFVSSLDWEYPG